MVAGLPLPKSLFKEENRVDTGGSLKMVQYPLKAGGWNHSFDACVGDSMVVFDMKWKGLYTVVTKSEGELRNCEFGKEEKK
jgi:hypothetical protein